MDRHGISPVRFWQLRMEWAERAEKEDAPVMERPLRPERPQEYVLMPMKRRLSHDPDHRRDGAGCCFEKDEIFEPCGASRGGLEARASARLRKGSRRLPGSGEAGFRAVLRAGSWQGIRGSS